MTLSVTFSQSFFEQNFSVQLNYCDFQRFLLFRNKAEWRRTGISFAVTSGQRRPDEDMLREEEEEIKPEMQDVLPKKMRDFPHDCGTVDT